MDICTKFENLRQLLENHQQQNDTTFGLVFIPNTLTADDIIAVRTSDKWCDVTVCVILNKNLTAKQNSLLQNAGVDILLDCPQEAPELPLNSGNINSGFLLKVILLVMPSAVIVQLNELDLLKVLLKINYNYQDLFTFIYSQTPISVLSETQQDIRKNVLLIQKMIKLKEKNITKLIDKFNKSIKQKYSVDNTIEFIDNKGENCKDKLSSGENFMHISLEIDEIKIQDSIQITIS